MPIARFEMPDGRIARFEVPDGTTPEQAQEIIQKHLPQMDPNVAPSKLKGGSVGGVFMGLRDAVDGGAQLLVRGASKIGLADDAEVERVDGIVTTANREYEQSRRMAGREGIDLARITGNIINPVNRVVPMGGATSTAGAAVRAGAQGAISGAAQPVTDPQNFWGEKGTQVGVGTVAGAAGGAIVDKLVQGAGNLWANMRARPMFQPGLNPQVQADTLLAQAAAQQGIDLQQIPQSILADIRSKVKLAVSQGKTIDPATLVRQAEGRAVLGDDAALLRGQASRDPQQFTQDIDLRGIAGAGKPVADRLNLQNQRFIDKVRGLGAKGAPDAYEAGTAGIKSLQAHDEKLSAGVREAYTKFRNATGSTADVPLAPLAQRYGEVLDQFGAENIPSAVREKLRQYGLDGMKQTKVFDLLEADKLIKTINANIDPMKAPQAAALGQLRKALNESIELAVKQGDEATGPSADLLKDALKVARERFSLHEKLPALADAAKSPKAQERFVRDYVTSKTASVDTVTLLTKTLDPSALDMVRRNVLAEILEKAAPGAARGSDAAVFSQAGFNNALEGIGERKLNALFGKEGVSQLRQVGRVAEWAQKQPKGSAVNNSNSGAAVMNLLQGLAGRSESPVANKLAALPGVNLLRDSLGKSLDEAAVSNALRANVSPASPKLAPEEVNALRRYLPLVGGAAGLSAAGGL